MPTAIIQGPRRVYTSDRKGDRKGQGILDLLEAWKLHFQHLKRVRNGRKTHRNGDATWWAIAPRPLPQRRGPCNTGNAMI